MLKGTRVIEGKEAILFSDIIRRLTLCVEDEKFEQVFFPSICEQKLFTDKIGEENTKSDCRRRFI